METLRLADPATGVTYPLPVTGVADWRPVDGGIAVDVALPTLPPGTILVPSLALPDPAPAYHQWTLVADGGTWRLPPVPSDATAQPSETHDPRVSQHIDCWHTHATLTHAIVQVLLPARTAPARYLLCVSARPLHEPTPGVPQVRQALAVAPPALSQMTARAELAPRICSPISLAMVLARRRALAREPGLARPQVPAPRQVPANGDACASADWQAIVDECRDPATGMYGVWPLAIAAAARRGSLGAVEVFTDWAAPLAVLERGVPLVTSIRFEDGALPGAPLSRTAGHLVVLFAAGPDFVAVNDPAAPDTASVTRQYSAAAFGKAWLGHRGAAYILPS